MEILDPVLEFLLKMDSLKVDTSRPDFSIGKDLKLSWKLSHLAKSGRALDCHESF